MSFDKNSVQPLTSLLLLQLDITYFLLTLIKIFAITLRFTGEKMFVEVFLLQMISFLHGSYILSERNVIATVSPRAISSFSTSFSVLYFGYVLLEKK